MDNADLMCVLVQAICVLAVLVLYIIHGLVDFETSRNITSNSTI